jgi:hypothetical protein
MFGFTTLAISAVTAAATMFAPLTGASPPSSAVCGSAIDAGAFRPAWCGKKPPPKSYEKFRKALAAYYVNNADLAEAIATALGSFQPINAQCKDNPPVDQTTVDIIVGGMYLNGNLAKQRAEKALADMTAVVDAVFEPPTLPEAKAVLIGLRGKMDEFGRLMKDVDSTGDLYKASACDAAEDAMVRAAADLVTIGSFSTTSATSLSTMLMSTHEPCKTTKVKDPYTDKAMRKAAGAKATKTTSAGDMSMQYPTSLDVAGTGVWLPVNLDSTAPSGYVQVVLTQGAKGLAAVGGGTPAGESGLRIKVFGKPKPGKATLRLTFQPAGGAEVTKAVTLKLG